MWLSTPRAGSPDRAWCATLTLRVQCPQPRIGSSPSRHTGAGGSRGGAMSLLVRTRRLRGDPSMMDTTAASQNAAGTSAVDHREDERRVSAASARASLVRAGTHDGRRKRRPSVLLRCVATTRWGSRRRPHHSRPDGRARWGWRPALGCRRRQRPRDRSCQRSRCHPRRRRRQLAA